MAGTVSGVARGRKPLPRWGRICVGAALVGGGLGFLLWMFSDLLWGGGETGPQAPSGPQPSFTMGQSLAAPVREAQQAAKEVAPLPASTRNKADDAPPTPPPPIRRQMAIWQATTLGTASAAVGKPKAADDDDDDEMGGTGTSKDSAYAKSMVTTAVADVRPALHRYPPRYTIKKGETFDCTPPMPLSTQLTGPLFCLVNKPGVFSEDRNTLLIPEGSQVNGVIEQAMTNGSDSAVVVFTDVLTAGPDFLPIPLGSSLGASELGQNGVPMDVNEHLWAKVKVAVMFAGIDFASSAVTAGLQHGGNSQYNFGPITSGGQSLAQTALAHDIQIPTTGYRGPGYAIKVYVNHYIDLSRFYKVELTRGRARE